MRWRGHVRTLAPKLVERFTVPSLAGARPWATTLVDPALGPVRLSGRFDAAAGAAGDGPLLVVVHGLGGSAESAYVRRAAAIAAARGWSVLRLNLRGADRSGEDFYHAGLTADLAAALADPALAGFAEIAVVGFSLGGHAVLRHATEAIDPRVVAVAAVCPPLDLSACADAIDRPAMWPYRVYLLSGLREIYAEVARRRPVPTPPAATRGIATIREWDERVVAPRHGFAGAADYYARMSVGPRLGALRVPSLLVAGLEDPMVPPETYGGLLAEPQERLAVHHVAGAGHLGFAAGLDLGAGGPPGLERQVLAWLERRLAMRSA